MNLSNKAARYLNKLKRNPDFVITDRDEAINYFRKQNIPAFENVINFQMEYSGFAFTIFNDKDSAFEATLFSRHDVTTNTEIEFIKIDGQYYFYCGDHRTAQLWFVLSERGELCTYNNNEVSVNIIFSSFDKFVESYAFKDLLNKNNRYEHPPYYNLVNRDTFEKFTEHYNLFFTANDDYNKWLTKDDLIIHQGTMLDSPTPYIHVYGDSKANCQTFIDSLKECNIIN